MAKLKFEETENPIFTWRTIVAAVLFVLGVAWIVYYYTVVRVDPFTFPAESPGSPGFMADLKDWNYLIGFGDVILALMLAAHPSTPLGRGRGVVGGMLFCFLFGLLWICTFYVVSDDISKTWVMNDLGQWNLAVGISFMAAGFSYATRWE